VQKYGQQTWFTELEQQPCCKKKCAAPKKAVVKKICEIQSGSQEMAVIVG